MFEAAVGAVVAVDEEVDDVLYVKDVEAVLDLLEVEAFYQIYVVL